MADVMSLPTAAGMNGVEAELTCDMCSKIYQRRDLMMRHRRRCQGPKRLINRRKACDACVQAKAKCCYTQPACLRCVKRGTHCLYTTSSGAPDQEERTEIMNSLNLASSNQSLEFDLSGFDFSPSFLPLDFFDTTMTEVSGPVLASGPAIVEPPIDKPLDLTSSDRLPHQLSAVPDNSPILDPVSLPSNDTARSPSSPTCQIVRVLGGYAPLLTKGSFFSPFVHLSQYPLNGNNEPDLTSFPQSSMAICSSSGVNLSTDKPFFRRAMLAARQRLIDDFPSLECMQQWDAVHAMSIYESLELGERIDDESGAWKIRPLIKGLGSSFFLKMVRKYLQHYPDLRNSDVNAFSNPKSSPCGAAVSTWARWRITETARRTIFFANMLNFCSNVDHRTGRLSPYYEALDDDLILDMPLPCSHAAWVARDEDSWILAMRNDPTRADRISIQPDHTGIMPFVIQPSLKTILSDFRRGCLQVQIGTRTGFGDSDELRRLIIFCASEQFNSSSQ